MPSWGTPAAPLPIAPRRRAARVLAVAFLLGATTVGCNGDPGSNAGPSWGLPIWPSRSFSPPSDAKPPWLSPTPPAPVPRIPVPEGAFQA